MRLKKTSSPLRMNVRATAATLPPPYDLGLLMNGSVQSFYLAVHMGKRAGPFAVHGFTGKNLEIILPR
jgi:hypothetical protein